MKNRKYFWLVMLFCFVIALLVFYKVSNKPHRNIQKEVAAFNLSADQLYDAFNLDENAANEKYLDKVIVVNGKIESISKNQEGMPVILLSAEQAMMGGISGTLAPESGVANYSPGEEIRLKCRCTGMLMDVVLIDCSIQNAS